MKKPTVLTARTHADLLAAVPCILGFEPEESLVLLTFGRLGSAFHARVDLPTTPDKVAEVVEAMVSAATANGVTGVAIIAYTPDRAAACRAADALAFVLATHGIGVSDMLLVHGDQFWPLWPDDRDTAGPSRFDAHSHPFRAEAVMRGRVVHESRAELDATLDAVAAPDVVASIARWSGRDQVQEAAEALWLAAALTRLARSRTTPSADDAARLLVALGALGLIHVALTAMDDEEPDDWLDVWSHLLRCSPEELRPAPAALLAFAAWRAGQGALAWCAVDRCRALDPDHGLARVVAVLLERAVPPSSWTSTGASP